jgi:hypothetical protein
MNAVSIFVTKQYAIGGTDLAHSSLVRYARNGCIQFLIRFNVKLLLLSGSNFVLQKIGLSLP